MNEEYDVIVCGFGLKECILWGLLSRIGKKILHLDKNNFFGAETASFNLTQLWEMFRPNVNHPKEFGLNRDWNIDLIPKFLLANGLLVKMLLHINELQYVEFKSIDHSYVL